MGYLNFVFDNGDREYGRPAEVPTVNIAGRALPPLGKAFEVVLTHPDRSFPEHSWLCIRWRVAAENVWLKVKCIATDPRIKAQLVTDQAIKRRLADFLFNHQGEEIKYGRPRHQLPALALDQSLPIEEVPPELRTAVDQIAKWARFVAPYQLFCEEYPAQVEDGIYYLVVDWTHFTCASKISEWEALGPLFNFDPVTQPPSLTDTKDAVYWEIPDINLRVAVPFHGMIQAFAVHFGVDTPCREYQEKEAERQAANNASHRAAMNWAREDSERAKARLLDVL